MAKTLSTDVFIEGPFLFLEGPRWYEGQLWFSDMLGQKVYRASADGSYEAVIDVPNRPSGLGFLPDGTLLIVSMQDRTLYRLEDGALVVHADLSGISGGDANDMLVDDDGYAYVGNFGFDFWNNPTETVPADLAVVSPDGNTVSVAASDLSFPNGIVKTGSGRLVVAETHAHRLTSFAVNGDKTLSDRRLFAELPGAAPDGIAIDGEDGVWVSAARQSRFLRVEDDGRITHEIDVAPRLSIACAIGGANGDTLFCLTAAPDWPTIRALKSDARVETVHIG